MDEPGRINGNGNHSIETDMATMRQVDAFRVKEGEVWFVATLAEEYGGLFTHYFQKRSRICKGADCLPAVHRLDRVWKGYTAVLVYHKPSRAWFPKVLEITAHLELDFRDIFTRGQEWELYRNAASGGKSQPVMGKLHKPQIEWRLPPAFDILNVLKVLYSSEAVALDQLNPLPRRTFVATVAGNAPGALAERIDEEDRIKVAQEARQKALQERRRSPSTQN